MLQLGAVHHIAIICSNFEISKKFYTEVLGFTVVRQNYRSDRNSFKLDLSLRGLYIVELFSFPDSPARPSHPEACGLRHLAFGVADLDESVRQLSKSGIISEPVRVDPYTGKRFTFFSDPDLLPIELCES